jgi:hypothetical protein
VDRLVMKQQALEREVERLRTREGPWAPVYLRLTRRTTAQNIGSGSWANRYMNTVEWGSAGAGIAGTDLCWMHTALVFSGSGLDDLSHLGLATYPEATYTPFALKITVAGATDSFQYSVDGGASWNGSDIAITGASQTLGGTKDVRVQFAATTGHTLNDRWDWNELPRSSVYVLQAGIYQAVTTLGWAAAAGVTLPYLIGIGIKKNNTSYEGTSVQYQITETANDFHTSAIMSLAVGDTVQPMAYQASGVTKTIGAVTDNNQHWNTVTIARVA